MQRTMSEGSVTADAQLVDAARGGDRGAFATLVGRHRAIAERMCGRVIRDAHAVEDIVQEAVVQAWLSLSKLRQADRFGPWLIGIALHMCRRRARYRADQEWSLEALVGGRVASEPCASGLDLADIVERDERAQRIRDAVARLPDGQREAVALFYFGDLSHAGVADALGIPVGAVKTRLHKARAQLRRGLTDLSREETMSSETLFIDVEVEDVRALSVEDPPVERRIVVLHDRSGERVLPLWVGTSDGDAIAIQLLRAEAQRPLTHVLAARLVTAAGARIREVRIDRLVDETYYAQVVIDTAAGSQPVDARPSDAIALALEVGAPIGVHADVLERAGMTRAELADRRGASLEARSAVAHADQIRERVRQPRNTWASSRLF